MKKVILTIGFLAMTAACTSSPTRDAQTGNSKASDRSVAQATAYDPCKEPQPSTASMRACANEGFTAVDAQLNATYKLIVAKYKASNAQYDLDHLVAEENAWISFRDSQCNAEAAGEAGGSDQAQMITDCQTGLENVRNTELKGLLEGLAK